MTALHKTKWFLPLFSVALGLLFLGALWAGGERRTGLESLAIMTGLGPPVPARWPERHDPGPPRRRTG